MWSVENAENLTIITTITSAPLPLKRCIIAFSLLNRTLFIQAIKNVSKKVNKRIKLIKNRRFA